MIPETYSDERLVQIVQINRERLHNAALGSLQREFLDRAIREALDTLRSRGVDTGGIAA